MSDARWIREAIALAAAARQRGDEPFGALLVHNGESILTARNAITTENDLTQHAELRLISKASKQLDAATVAAATLYTSTEPCAMCAGAIYWSGITRMVFGFSAIALEDMTGGTGLHQPSRRVLGSASHHIDIIGPVLEAEARSVHEGFW
ncbi:MAG: nucleoside deaminase [Acidimicrobiia bacterium]|nr:nucleoside deaminase [Acidimicrobiia bacterium]MDX2468576.1 nucleoside deaminase [Acidimicrobiia bacterium]